MRPIEYFMSHQNEDRPDVVDLEGAMRRRGLASWRDRRCLLAGADNDTAIRRGVDAETTGFVLYGSDRIMSSRYVWDREWPWAHERYARERANGHPAPYRIVPLLIDGLDYRMLRQVAVAAGHADPTAFNGENLRRSDRAGQDAVARWLLRAALADRAREHDDPLRVRLSTFDTGLDVEADVLVDWEPEFRDGDVDWSLLQAALADVKAELAALHRPIEIDAQARLAAAFVFGHAFPLAARVSVTAVHRDGQRWTTSPKPDLSAVSAPPVNTIETGDPRVAVVEVSFGRRVEVESGETVTAHGIAPGRIARIGPRNAACGVDATTAAAAAATFGRVLRGMRDDGVQEAHLFISAPAALVVLLGASVNAGPAMTLYHTAEGRYVPSVRLEA